MIIGIMGVGRSGKDTAAEWLVEHTNLKYRGSTSIIISEEIARRENITFEEAHSQRHERREYWRMVGDEMRIHDSAALAREVLKDSNLIVGIRSYLEMEKIKQERLCDIIIWISRLDVAVDPTIEFGSEMCDIVIENHWGFEEYYERLNNLSKILGLKI